MSGLLSDRDGLNRLLAFVQTHRNVGGVVIIHDRSRLSRADPHEARGIERQKSHGLNA